MAATSGSRQALARRYQVTGGAGYVGSHLVAALAGRGDTAVVLDNLRTGHRSVVPPGIRLIVADLADTGAVEIFLADGPWHAVFHFAALSQLGESKRLPFRYRIDNSVNGMRLMEACVQHGVLRFVMSSSARCTGPNASTACAMHRCAISTPQAPIRKDASERTNGRKSHLIPLAIDPVLGRRPELEVYGGDYATPDGTCLRDYMCMSPIWRSPNLLALDRLERGSVTVNLGNGMGHSVLQVIEAVQRVSRRKVPYRLCPRRRGDSAVLVASSERTRR